jgi:hypothetical protein
MANHAYRVPNRFIVLKAGVNRPPDDIERECVVLVREKIGPVAAFKLAITVGRLSKTRSGKILRGTMKKDGESWTMSARELLGARDVAFEWRPSPHARITTAAELRLSVR